MGWAVRERVGDRCPGLGQYKDCPLERQVPIIPHSHTAHLPTNLANKCLPPSPTMTPVRWLVSTTIWRVLLRPFLGRRSRIRMSAPHLGFVGHLLFPPLNLHLARSITSWHLMGQLLYHHHINVLLGGVGFRPRRKRARRLVSFFTSCLMRR